MPVEGEPPVEELPREQCLHLLQYGAYVGRVAFILDGRAIVLPVNYLAEGSSIVFCTAAGTKLTALAAGADVAFEVDDGRPLYRAGWSVVVRGEAREVSDQQELERLRRGPLKSWATHPKQHWIRITIEEISGRRIPET